MSFSYAQHIERALASPSPNMDHLVSQLQRSSKHHSPGRQDIEWAVASGHAGVVNAVASAPILDDSQRRELATQGLQAWAANPLASPQAAGVVDALMNAGADTNKADPEGLTPAQRISDMRERIHHEERQAPKTGRRATVGPTKAGTVLEACAQSMGLSSSARPTLVQWRNGRSANQQPSPQVRHAHRPG